MTVDTRYTPIRHILQYVDGSRWRVRYYSQALARDSELSPQQDNLSPVYQQYRCIDGLILMASRGLELSQDEESKSMVAVGTSTVMSGDVIPNKGDQFLADIGDGQEGIFSVTDSTKLTHLKDALYEIEYSLVSTTDQDPTRRNDLEAKVIQEFVFVQDHLKTGENPIITRSAYVQRERMEMVTRDLINQYFQDFFSHERSTLLIPDQTEICYDPFLTTFVRDVVNHDESRWVNFVDIPEVLSIPGMRQQTIWDALRVHSHSMVRSVARRAGLLSSRFFRGQAHYAGAYYAGLGRVVYPLDPRTDPDVRFDRCKPSASGAVLIGGDVRRGDIQEYLAEPVTGFTYTQDATDVLPYIVPVTADDRYVFTNKFYLCEGPYSSQLERITHQMLNNEPIDKAMVLKLAEAANRWPNLERFYYVPVMLALLRVSIRTS